MPDHEREPTPEQEAEVRRLLAAARATEPVPPDVAARLDRVLEGLDQERGGPPASRRRVVAPAWRRRRATALLAAAAAVVGIGVGIGQIDDLRGGGDDSGGAADGGAVSTERRPTERRPTDRRPAERGPTERGPTERGLTESGSTIPADPAARDDGASAFASTRPDTGTPVGRVRETSFTADADLLRRAIPAGVDGGFVRLAADRLPRGYVLTGRPFDCSAAAWGPGVLVPVYFEGMPAVLAYRPAIGESQIVELLQCGTGEARRSTTLRAG